MDLSYYEIIYKKYLFINVPKQKKVFGDFIDT